MNVYDFDGTLYHGDSSMDFCLFSLKKHPALLRYLPRMAWAFLSHYVLHRIDKTAMKERFFSFIASIDTAAMVDAFWDSHEKNIYSWYPGQHRDDDLVISASPEFLLCPICARLGIGQLMASRVDPATGRFTGGNCRDEEKVRRFRETYKEAVIDRFYSDSSADVPLAKLAGEAFLVGKQGEISPWPFHE